MPDLTLHDITPSQLARVQRLAAARGCSTQAALVLLVDCGLECVETPDDLDADHARVLEEATIALRNLRSDAGFALIGRPPLPLPPPKSQGGESVRSVWDQLIRICCQTSCCGKSCSMLG